MRPTEQEVADEAKYSADDVHLEEDTRPGADTPVYERLDLAGRPTANLVGKRMPEVLLLLTKEGRLVSDPPVAIHST